MGNIGVNRIAPGFPGHSSREGLALEEDTRYIVTILQSTKAHIINS